MNLITRWKLRLPLHDYTNGYLVIRRADIDQVLRAGQEADIRPFDHILYGVAIFSLASRIGIPLAEVQAPYHFRDRGESKIRTLAGIRLFFDTMKLTDQCARLLKRKTGRP